MQRTSVQSSNILSYGYDAERRVLEVEFTGGTVYQFSEVDPTLVEGFRAAPSKGRYFQEVIRGRFPTVRLAATMPCVQSS